MNPSSHVQDFFDRITSLAPIPPEAYPGGALGKMPGVHSLIEVAWDQMALTMFVGGFVAGLMVGVLVFLGIVFKTSFPTLMRAIAHASI